MRWSLVCIAALAVGCDPCSASDTSEPVFQDGREAAAHYLSRPAASLGQVHVSVPDGAVVGQGDLADESHTMILDGCGKRAICRYHGGVMNPYGWHCESDDPHTKY